MAAALLLRTLFWWMSETRGAVKTEFDLTIRYGDDLTSVECKGELDLSTSPKLKDAVEICVERTPRVLELDLGGLSLLSSSGIEAILYAVGRCRDAGVVLNITLSEPARRVLDLVGLWWVGVIDDGLSIEHALRDALRTYKRVSPDLIADIDVATDGPGESS